MGAVIAVLDSGLRTAGVMSAGMKRAGCREMGAAIAAAIG